MNPGAHTIAKVYVGSGIFFGFHHDVTLSHNIATGIIRSKNRSKDDILFIESCQLYRI